jgi:arginyl-tRNA synthetase
MECGWYPFAFGELLPERGFWYDTKTGQFSTLQVGDFRHIKLKLNQNPNAVSSHWHFNDVGVSWGDVRAGLWTRELETRVVDDDYLYILRFPTVEKRGHLGTYHRQVSQYFKELIGAEKIGKVEVYNNLPDGNTHKALSMVASVFEFTYERIERIEVERILGI